MIKDKKLRKHELIKINGNKFLVLSSGKKELVLFPIDPFLDGETPELVPKMRIGYELIESIEVEIIDPIELLYLVNHNYPTITKVLEEHFYARK